MTFSDPHSPTSVFPLPDRITGKLPISHWAVYIHILTTRLEQDLPGCDKAEYINLALGQLQMISYGNAALDSLAVSRAVDLPACHPLIINVGVQERPPARRFVWCSGEESWEAQEGQGCVEEMLEARVRFLNRG